MKITRLNMNYHAGSWGKGFCTPNPVVTLSPPRAVTLDVFDIKLNISVMQTIDNIEKYKIKSPKLPRRVVRNHTTGCGVLNITSGPGD